MKFSPILTHQSPWYESPSLEHGKCWIFPSNLDLSQQFNLLADTLDPFLKNWTAHGAQVEAEAALLYGHFLVVVEGLQGESSSGCSQDALRSVITALESRLGTPFLAGGRIFYQNPSREGQVEVTTRLGFQAAVKSGALGPETMVFDTLVQKVGDLKLGRFLLPAKASWHQKLFGSVLSVS